MSLRSFAFGAIAALSSAVFAIAAERVAPDQFDELHALIKPKSGEEKWSQLPWLASLWKARAQAAAEGKPILLWEMDGHPLGCT
jgi:hypothetical protein